MSRRHSIVLCSALALLTLQGCFEMDATGLDMDSMGGGGAWNQICTGPVGTITTVSVFAARPDYLIELGDTVTLTAVAMDGACKPVVVDLMKSWSTSFRDTLAIRPFGPAGDRALFVARQTGHADIMVWINNVVGLAGLRGIPRIHGITVAPASATISVGDSILVSAVVRDTAGALVNYPPVFNLETGVIEAHYHSDSAIWIIGRKPGNTSVEGRMLKHAATSEITVVAR